MKESAIQIWPIKGGLSLATHKAESTQHAIISAEIPKQLIIPLRQHRGKLPSPNSHLSIGDYVYKGQPLNTINNDDDVLVHASSSGTISAIEAHPIAHHSGLSETTFTIDTDQRDDWGCYQLPTLKDFEQQEIATLIQRIHEAGIVGLGGATFPTGIKVQTPQTKAPLQTLIINAAECEPYISCDDMLMREAARDILTGICILLRILQPQRCLIGIEDNKPHAILAMEQAAAELLSQNTLTAQDFDCLEIISIPSIYPSGDEKQLIHILTGQAIPKQQLPSAHHIQVYNIATVHSIYRAMIHGEPLIERIVTVTGSGVHTPRNVRARIGSLFSDIISHAGGYTEKAQRLLMGGPMMGIQLPHDQVPITKASNCILVTSKAELPYQFDNTMPCIRCSHCVDVCPVDLLPQQLYWHSKAHAFDKAEEHHLFDCIECGCCSYVCPSHIPLVEYYRFAKSELRDQKEKHQRAELARERYEFLQFRKERNKAEREAKRAEHRRALEERKATTTATASTDNKSDAIKAALARAKAKKSALKQRNTEQLTPQQQKQIDAIDAQRKAIATAPNNQTKVVKE